MKLMQCGEKRVVDEEESTSWSEEALLQRHTDISRYSETAMNENTHVGFGKTAPESPGDYTRLSTSIYRHRGGCVHPEPRWTEMYM